MNTKIAIFCVAFIITIKCLNGNKLARNQKLITNETEGEIYLNITNQILGQQINLITEAEWKYNTNITDQTSDELFAATDIFYAFQKNQSIETRKYDWSNFSQYNQRQFAKLAVIGTAALDSADATQFTRVSNEMETIYSSATINIPGLKPNLELDPDLTDIMATSTNYTELEEVWTLWRDATGKKMRDLYITYYTLGNKAAPLNDIPGESFHTLDDLWLFSWETPDIKDITANLWQQMKPLYEKVHAYIRIKLNATYPGKMPNDKTIPANILGNMWAQSWSNIMGLEGIDPYPNLQTIDVTQALINQSYNATRMFHLADDFFADLGLDRMTPTFWNKSVIVKPDDGTIMVCHASAWDFYVPNDFRIKQCTNINMEDLITIHHEMGHIEYFMQYAQQPVIYRDGANPGFHEAIGDLLALSVSTPKHLQKLGLLGDINEEELENINLKYQLKMALDKVVFLPFAFLMDKYRWDVFSGAVSPNDLNRYWWQLRLQYQGVSPPVKRSEQDFDPGAKYHIPAGVEYIRYFVSHILQFQFQKALCDIAQPGVPLYECDIDGNEAAGNVLKTMLQKGSSMKWPEQLKLITNTTVMDVQPLLEYFQPLSNYLDQQLAGITLGWNATVDDYFISTPGSGSLQILSSLYSLVFVIILMVFNNKI